MLLPESRCAQRGPSSWWQSDYSESIKVWPNYGTWSDGGGGSGGGGDDDDTTVALANMEKEQQQRSRSTYTLVTVVPGHCVTTPLLRGTVAPRLSKPRGICARIRFWIARRLGRPYERIALPRRIFCRIASSETLAAIYRNSRKF